MSDFFSHNLNIAKFSVSSFQILCYNTKMANQIVKANFATDIIDELKKVSWPTKAETIRLTTIVIIVSLIIGLYVGIIDILLAKGLEIITKFR